MNGFFLGISEAIRKYWTYGVLGIFAVNIFVIDLFLFFPKSQLSQNNLSEIINLPNVSQNYCPQSCLNQIDTALKSQYAGASSSAKEAAITIQSPISSVSPTSTPVPAPTSFPTAVPVKTVKEFFVPLGTGTGKSGDWTVIDGMGAKIDPADYGDVKQITFEVAAFIPTGNQTVWIRLYNANTYQSVAGSEISLEGGNTVLLVSSPINLASGNNSYQVQMKTQLKYPANINMARLRIKTN